MGYGSSISSVVIVLPAWFVTLPTVLPSIKTHSAWRFGAGISLQTFVAPRSNPFMNGWTDGDRKREEICISTALATVRYGYAMTISGDWSTIRIIWVTATVCGRQDVHRGFPSAMFTTRCSYSCLSSSDVLEALRVRATQAGLRWALSRMGSSIALCLPCISSASSTVMASSGKGTALLSTLFGGYKVGNLS